MDGPEDRSEARGADEQGGDGPGEAGSRLLSVFALDDLGADRYQATNPDHGISDRVFGGQVAAQALWAAQRTVAADHRIHSLHGYFLLGGKPGVPIVYAVERLRDGRSFTTRAVEALQGDEVIFNLSASFHREESGPDYQRPLAMDVPMPEDAPERMLFIPEEERPRLPFELRELGPTEPDEHGYYRSTRRAWMRIKGSLPDDPTLHACMLTWLSDMGAVLSAMAPLPEHRFDRVMGASLDHAMWFHRPMRADEWFLYDGHAVSNAGSRGLMQGTMHTADGTLGVSLAQEALIRIRRPPS